MHITSVFKALLPRRPRRLNIYRQRFTAICPNNGEVIQYLLRISTCRTIFVEEIQAACAEQTRGFHEDIADALFARLGGVQNLRAVHHGTAIESVRAA